MKTVRGFGSICFGSSRTVLTHFLHLELCSGTTCSFLQQAICPLSSLGPLAWLLTADSDVTYDRSPRIFFFLNYLILSGTKHKALLYILGNHSTTEAKAPASKLTGYLNDYSSTSMYTQDKTPPASSTETTADVKMTSVLMGRAVPWGAQHWRLIYGHRKGSGWGRKVRCSVYGNQFFLILQYSSAWCSSIDELVFCATQCI